MVRGVLNARCMLVVVRYHRGAQRFALRSLAREKNRGATAVHVRVEEKAFNAHDFCWEGRFSKAGTLHVSRST